jgi:opine dehydrogenase
MDRIAVLGGGNGACSLAADLVSRGYSVNLAELPSYAEKFAPVIEKGGLSYTGAIGEGFAKLNKVTMNIQDAISKVKYILISVPAYGQKAFAEACAPFLEDGQIVILVTGNMGSLEFSKVLKERGIHKKIILAETDTLPYGTRLQGPTLVNVEYKASISVAAFPSRHTGEVVRDMGDMFSIRPANNVVEMSLLNTNLLLHPEECIFNAGRIEYSKGEFYSHGEGFTPVVARFSVKVYRELKAVAKSISMDLDIWKIASDFFGVEYDVAMAKQVDEMDENVLAKYFSEMVQASPLAKVKGPGYLDYRYLTEDVPYGLVTATSIGDMMNVDTKLIKTLIYLASIINQRDHMKEGRTVEKLGIAGMSSEQLNKYLREG